MDGTAMRLRLYENYRFVLYAPFYAAHATGAYAAEGLDVDLAMSPGTGKAEAALIDGAVDVIWAGPMRVMKHHDDNPGSPLVCFAEIVCRDPFSIVGRYPKPDFRLSDLADLRFATVSEVPTPWLCLQHDLREAGLDPDRLDRIADCSMADNLTALGNGRIDAAQFFEPVVEMALAGGAGHLWYAASTRGRTTYTTFVTTRDRLARDEEPLRRMVRAIGKTLQWVYASSPADIAAALASFFPMLERSTLAGAINRYRIQEVWSRDAVMPEDGFDRLGHSLVSGGFIRKPPNFAACVDNRLALQAASSGRMTAQV
jgi:NitT/TauT family transport system substrate-binding protein